MVQQRNAPHASFNNNNNNKYKKKKARISALKTTVIHSLIRRFIIKPEILCFTMTDSQWVVLSPDGSGGGVRGEEGRSMSWGSNCIKKHTQENTSLFYGSNKHTNKKRIWRKSCLYNCLKVRPSVFWFLCMVQLYLIAQEVLFFAQFSWKSLLLSKLFSGLFCRVWRVRLIASNVNI